MRKLKNVELDRITPAEFKNAKKAPITLLLENVRSMNNVGSAFRTADAFLLEKIYLTGITGRPPHREINRTALGATESVEWEYHKSGQELIKKLRSAGHCIISIEQADKSIPLQDFKPQLKQHYVLVFGNEIKGVDENIVGESDHVLEIPQFGTKHSLNIAVSIGVVAWEFYSKLYLRK